MSRSAIKLAAHTRNKQSREERLLQTYLRKKEIDNTMASLKKESDALRAEIEAAFRANQKRIHLGPGMTLFRKLVSCPEKVVRAYEFWKYDLQQD